MAFRGGTRTLDKSGGTPERNANNCLAAMPVLVAALAAVNLGGAWRAVASGCLVTAAVALCLSNQIHAWAHTARPPPLVRWLQAGGVLLRPDRRASQVRIGVDQRNSGGARPPG
jgi:hypothetical protein